MQSRREVRAAGGGGGVRGRPGSEPLPARSLPAAGAPPRAGTVRGLRAGRRGCGGQRSAARRGDGSPPGHAPGHAPRLAVLTGGREPRCGGAAMETARHPRRRAGEGCAHSHQPAGARGAGRESGAAQHPRRPSAPAAPRPQDPPGRHGERRGCSATRSPWPGVCPRPESDLGPRRVGAAAPGTERRGAGRSPSPVTGSV